MNGPAHHDDEYLDLCAAHALGSLDPSDSARLQDHLEGGCGVCRAELEAHRATVESLGRSLPPLEPPPELEARVMDRVAPADLSARRKPSAAAGAAGRWAMRVAALVVLGFVSWKAFDSGREVARLSARNDSLQEEITRLSRPEVEAYHLAATEHRPEAKGHAYRDSHRTPDPADDELILHVTDLEPAGEADDYHAWLVAGGETHDLGSLLPGEPGEHYASIAMPIVREPFRIQVTLEHSREVLRPSGPVILSYTSPPERR
jgi:hypothetical protein